ncbi:MAG: hypothetical protein RI894_2076 [Bacteroidota bacterium]
MAIYVLLFLFLFQHTFSTYFFNILFQHQLLFSLQHEHHFHQFPPPPKEGGGNRFFLYSQVLKEGQVAIVAELLNTMRGFESTIFCYTPYLEQLKAAKVQQLEGLIPIATHPELLAADVDFAITLGGDGTILSAIQLIRDSGIRILGINLGRLGFLTTANAEQTTDAIRHLITGDFSIDPRRLIRLDSSPNLFNEFPYALNDFTIVKRETSSMIIVHTYMNGAFLNSYWADGLIISTPSGSTGYSLSCGGPIIFPNSGNFVVTPIAPHNLNVRPIVLPDSATLSFEIEGRAESFLCTLDARFAPVTSAHKISVQCAPFRINLVRLYDYTFLQAIRSKLSWGFDTRN